LHETLTEAF
jgi:hypothetical protein